MNARLEHANITVRDIDAAIRFLRTAFPDFRVRFDSGASDERWVHVGSDTSYVAITQATRGLEDAWVPYAGRPGLNHLGFEVDNVEALRARMIGAGYRDSTIGNNHPHRKRVYFLDSDGNDWEFVEYTTGVPEERNDYTLDG
jgi:catechol 2,3-dioxygenase-like lactoylglutathione lyase family enzyme